MTEHSPIRVMRIITRLNIGGPTNHVCLLTSGLNDDEFETILVAGRVSEAEGDMSYLAKDLGITPHYVSSLKRSISFLDDLRTFFELLQLIRRERPHIVHTHMAKAGFAGRFAAFLSGVPVIIHTFHGHVFTGYFGRTMSSAYVLLERVSALYCNVILTISQKLKADLVHYKITAPDRIKIIPLGLELGYLEDLSAQRGLFRAELQCSTSDRLIGIIGRLVPVKNHTLFLNAARYVLQYRSDLKFLIVGDGELRNELISLTKDLGIENSVLFLGWRSDLAKIYADLDLAVITSKNEGTPVSLIEAMAGGVPVLSTAVGGVADLLNGGEFGRLVKQQDPEAIGQAILDVLSVDNVQQTKAAQKHVLDHYSADRLIQNIKQLYRDLLASKT